MRPEPELTIACCRDLAKGGALSMALGIESASPRVLDLIHKGVGVDRMKAAVKNLARAGIAVEAMCFTDFPGESYEEAIATLDFIQDLHKQIALFICGRFGLCHGARVARHPGEYNIETIWHVEGDDLRTALFYQERNPSKTELEKDRINEAIDTLSEGWWLHPYPWAGALSTAHSLLWYKHYGPDVFKRFSQKPRRAAVSGKPPRRKSAFDLRQMIDKASMREAEIWHELIYVQKAVSPERYARLCQSYPLELPKKRGSIDPGGSNRKRSKN
jgi:hypothetical protein